jgi:hypothetical protein
VNSLKSAGVMNLIEFKIKRLRNSHGNHWNGTHTTATVAADGLNVSITNGFPNVLAEQPFPISGPLSRMDEFPGTILYYYEVKGHLLMWVYIYFKN